MTQGLSPQQIASNVKNSQTTEFGPNSFEGKTASILFGRPNIPSLSSYGKEAASIIPGGEGFADRNPTAAFGLGLGLAALDFTGAGGSKNAIKTLTTLNKAEDTAKVLKQIGVAEDLITDYAPILAKAKTEAEVSKIINRISDIQKTTKSTPQQAIKPRIETNLIEAKENYLKKYPNGRMVIFSGNDEQKLVFKDEALPESFKSSTQFFVILNLFNFNKLLTNTIFENSSLFDSTNQSP